MYSFKGRPIITSADHPKIIYDALCGSVNVLRNDMPSDALEFWAKKAADARGALHDAFGIIGNQVYRPAGDEALLFMSPDELELALVGHGCELIDKYQKGIPPEVLSIDGLLKEIDRIKSTR